MGGVYFSILVVSCFMWSGALYSSRVLLSYHSTSLALHATITLISTLTRTHLYAIMQEKIEFEVLPKVVPHVIWGNSSKALDWDEITYGALLGKKQLNATCDVEGTIEYVDMEGLYLGGYCSILLLSFFTATNALGSPGLLPSYLTITISLHITIILIITLKSSYLSTSQQVLSPPQNTPPSIRYTRDLRNVHPAEQG